MSWYWVMAAPSGITSRKSAGVAIWFWLVVPLTRPLRSPLPIAAEAILFIRPGLFQYTTSGIHLNPSAILFGIYANLGGQAGARRVSLSARRSALLRGCGCSSRRRINHFLNHAFTDMRLLQLNQLVGSQVEVLPLLSELLNDGVVAQSRFRKLNDIIHRHRLGICGPQRDDRRILCLIGCLSSGGQRCSGTSGTNTTTAKSGERNHRQEMARFMPKI